MTMNFLFATWEGGGNVGPAVEAARKLAARGHRVRFMSDACNRADAERAGAEFRAWRRAPNRADGTPDSQHLLRDWAEPTPQAGIAQVIRDLWCGRAADYALDTLDELSREPADLVVSSEMLPGIMAACERAGQRFVILSANLSIRPLPGVPAIGPGLPPARTEQDRAVLDELAAGVSAMFDVGLPALNDARAAIGLGPLARVFDQFDEAELELLATARAFDFPSDRLPERVRYVGPQLAEPSWARPWRSPWPQDDPRPMIAVSFSTTFQNHGAVLQKVIDALAPLPARVLVTLGQSIAPDRLRPADNCVIIESAPHGEVMRCAALAVTHGGHGTVMRALVGRAPMLVLPHGRDQHDNAVRITERGAGLSLLPDAPVHHIRNACERLLLEPAFRAAARRLGDLVAREAEHSSIVEELETAAAARHANATG